MLAVPFLTAFDEVRKIKNKNIIYINIKKIGTLSLIKHLSKKKIVLEQCM